MRVSDQNGVSLLHIMLEINYSGREPSNIYIIYTHTCMHACMHPCIHTFIHTYIHTYIYIYIYIYIYRLLPENALNLKFLVKVACMGYEISHFSKMISTQW